MFSFQAAAAKGGKLAKGKGKANKGGAASPAAANAGAFTNKKVAQAVGTGKAKRAALTNQVII